MPPHSDSDLDSPTAYSAEQLSTARPSWPWLNKTSASSQFKDLLKTPVMHFRNSLATMTRPRSMYGRTRPVTRQSSLSLPSTDASPRERRIRPETYASN